MYTCVTHTYTHKVSQYWMLRSELVMENKCDVPLVIPHAVSCIRVMHLRESRGGWQVHGFFSCSSCYLYFAEESLAHLCPHFSCRGCCLDWLAERILRSSLHFRNCLLSRNHNFCLWLREPVSHLVVCLCIWPWLEGMQTVQPWPHSPQNRDKAKWMKHIYRYIFSSFLF